MKKIISFMNFNLFPSFVYGLFCTPSEKYIASNCNCRIVRGNLLSEEGDILLCPVSENFKPSNPLAQRILKKEGNWLTAELLKLDHEDRIGSAYTKYLPCKKLKYRGIIFVAVDFYSENRRETNIVRIAEAFKTAEKYKCQKLSCPENMVYSSILDNIYDDNYYSILKVFESIHSENLETNFDVDFVVRVKDLRSFKKYKNSGRMYDISNVFNEKIPHSAVIFPWYRKKLRKVRTGYVFGYGTAKMLRILLTEKNLTSKKIQRMFGKLRWEMGDYSESGIGRCHIGFACYLVKCFVGLPWNCKRIMEELDIFYSNQIDPSPACFEYQNIYLAQKFYAEHEGSD